MKRLDPFPKFIVWALWQSIRHPKTQITYLYCSDCKVRVNPKEGKCPVCGKSPGSSPELVHMSPVPWYCSACLIALGVISLIIGFALEMEGLCEVGRALVYVPLGNLFGLSQLK